MCVVVAGRVLVWEGAAVATIAVGQAYVSRFVTDNL